jgi:hypothetical protein
MHNGAAAHPGSAALHSAAPYRQRPTYLKEALLTQADDPRQNQLLAALLDAQWQRWQPLLDRIELPRGKVLHDAGAPLQHLYFPTGAIVSLLSLLGDGSSAEIAMIGFEGMPGTSIFMGGSRTPSRDVVPSAGTGWRLRAELVRKEFGRPGPVMDLMLRYAQALITQMSQMGVCNRHHSLDQQLCRWLLHSLDRLPGN